MPERRVSPGGRVTYSCDDDPHAVYRIYDATDRLIYTGCSYDPAARVRSHRTQKSWGGEIARWTEEWYPDRRTALKAERLATQRENPDYNVVNTELGRIVSTAHYGEGGRTEKAARIAAGYAARTQRIAAERLAAQAS